MTSTKPPSTARAKLIHVRTHGLEQQPQVSMSEGVGICECNKGLHGSSRLWSVSGSGAVTGCKWGQMVFSTAVHLPTTRNQA